MPVDFSAAQVTPDHIADEVVRLPHDRRPPFLYFYHPFRWAVEDGEWLPQLYERFVEVGTGGVDGRGDTAFMRDNERKKGAIPIERNQVPPGTPGNSYMHAFACRGGKYHCSVWEQPRAVGKRPVSSVVDTDGWRAYRRWLVESGVIPLPDDSILEKMTEDQRAKIGRIKAQASTAPHLADAVKAEEAKLDVMLTASPPSSEPKKRGRPPKAE